MRHHTVTLHQNAVKVVYFHCILLEAELAIINPIVSNNFCNSLAHLRVGYSHPQGDSLYESMNSPS